MKRLLVKQNNEDTDIKLQKLSNSPNDTPTMKQPLDNQKVEMKMMILQSCLFVMNLMQLV
jgi:hypothetical protein